MALFNGDAYATVWQEISVSGAAGLSAADQAKLDRNKGWFSTEAALLLAFPAANSGDEAIVGATDTKWVWDADTAAWVDTGDAPDDPNFKGAFETVALANGAGITGAAAGDYVYLRNPDGPGTPGETAFYDPESGQFERTEVTHLSESEVTQVGHGLQKGWLVSPAVEVGEWFATTGTHPPKGLVTEVVDVDTYKVVEKIGFGAIAVPGIMGVDGVGAEVGLVDGWLYQDETLKHRLTNTGATGSNPLACFKAGVNVVKWTGYDAPATSGAPTTGGPADTDALPEGATNHYSTDGRISANPDVVAALAHSLTPHAPADAEKNHTGAEISALLYAIADHNRLTDVLVAKINGIEAGATGDLTGAQISALLYALGDHNQLTDALVAKLNGIEAGATGDLTGAEIATLLDAEAGLEVMTAAERLKLAGLDDNHFKGVHVSLGALNTAHPTAAAGDYANVDSGAGSNVAEYIWDVDSAIWVLTASASTAETPASVLAKFTSNANANVLTDALLAKLNAIEAGATGDLTGAEISALLYALGDHNRLTDVLLAKLNGVEAGATGDQTGVEISALLYALADHNQLTDALVTKLNGIEAGATGDLTGAEIAVLLDAEAGLEVMTAAERIKLAGLDDNHFKGVHASLGALNTAHATAVAGDYANVDAGAGNDAEQYIWDVDDAKWVLSAAAATAETPATVLAKFIANANANVLSDALLAKLNAIEANATGDQTGAEISALLYALGDHNQLTDALLTKLTNIETGATGDQTGAEISGLLYALGDHNQLTDSLLALINGAVQKETFDANTILKADADNTPVALPVPASRVIGRGPTGNIDALTAALLLEMLTIAPVALTSAANVATDASGGRMFTLTPGVNLTMDSPTGMQAGGAYYWRFANAGGHAISFGSNFKFAGGAVPDLSAAGDHWVSGLSHDGVVIEVVELKSFA